MSSLSMARQLKSLIPLALGVAVLTTTGAARLPEGGTTKGVSFKLVMTLKQPITRGQKATEQSILHGTGTFANGRGRIDIDSSTGPVAYAKGDYFVIDSGHTILVRPSVQTCSEIESPIEHPLGRMVSQLANQQLGKSGVKVEMEWLGRTDSVAQTTTQHYRVQSEYAIDFGARQLTSHSTTDLWIARVPLRFFNPVDQTMRSPRMPTAFDAVFDRIASYSVLLAAEGAPIKSVTTTTFALGATTWNTVQTAEITNIHETDVDEVSFRMPDRYRKAQ